MALAKLDTTDPTRLIYQNELLTLTVMGGIRTEGLDRMRVTLKVTLNESSRPALRHNLDLYNETQVEKFTRKIAEKHEIGISVITASLSELIEALEAYRLEQLQATPEASPQNPALSEEAKQNAIKKLKAKNLRDQTLKALQATGIQGEETNTLILWYAMTSRKMEDPLSVICLAGSGTGKSYLMEKVGACIPEGEKQEHTQFTKESFYHFSREELKGRVLLIEDLDGAETVLYPIRQLQTKKRLSKTMTTKSRSGHLRTTTNEVEGPVSVIGCTTREHVYEDNANRALLIHLDNSKAQDERIMDYQKQVRAGRIDTTKEGEKQAELKAMQQVLEPVKVLNPYAPLIHLPDSLFKPRRALPLLLNFIEAITFYHQYQRKQKTDKSTGEIYIETHPEDIAQGFALLKELLFRKSDELTQAARSFYEWLIDWNEKRDKPQSEKGSSASGRTSFYARDIRQAIRIHPRTLNRHLQELTEFGLLQITGGNKHTTGYHYQIVNTSHQTHIKNAIDQAIEEVMQAVWEAYEKEASPGKSAKKPGKPVSQK